jgi:hypothetical protein
MMMEEHDGSIIALGNGVVFDITFYEDRYQGSNRVL